MSIPPVRTRAAQLEDLKAIVAFNLALARETEGLALQPAVVNEGVLAVLQDPAKGRYFVAEVEGRVVGQTLVTLEWSDWRNGWLWWLQSVYVDPAYRGRGVFRALYEHVRREAIQAGARALRLYVKTHNARAQAVYRALGMEPAGYDVWETGV